MHHKLSHQSVQRSVPSSSILGLLDQMYRQRKQALQPQSAYEQNTQAVVEARTHCGYAAHANAAVSHIYSGIVKRCSADGLQ